MASPRSAHPPIGSQPIAQQQTWIIEDILFVLMGIDGKYITRAESVSPYQCEFVVDPSLDISLSDLVIRIFPLARSFVIIEHFIETHSRFEYGRVNHALCRAMKSLTKEYMILLAQLEHEAHQSPEFGLHQLWFHVSPTLQTMTTLSSLIEAILLTESVGRDDVTTMALFHELHSSTRGGGVLLGVIADRMLSLSGDNSTKLLYSHLLSESAVPYFEMLRQWINRGEICDPYDEFMIQEQRGMSKEQLKDDFNDLYWDQRYVLRMDAVPNFLDPFKEKILLAGKYLNVVRECATTSNGTHFLEQRWREETKKYQESKNGGSSSGMVSGDVSRAIEGGRWADDIDLAYRFANETLLCMLVQEQELIPRLSSLKHYFFLDQSDWLTHFFDLALPELSKPSNKVGVEKVSSLLELVLRNPSSASSSDPYKDDVVIELSTISLAEHLLTVSTITGANSREQFMEGQHERIQRANLKSDQQLSAWASEGQITPDTYFHAIRLLPRLHIGIESFMLGYTVRFPLSLVLGKKYLIKYQLIFRHLFHCKYVERLLCGLWFDQTSFHRISRAKSRPSRAAAAENDSSESAESREESMLFMARLGALRTKMVHCVQQVLYYSCFEVLEPQWLNLEKTIKKATTVDEVLKLHMDFLDTCLKECTLTNQSLVKIFSEFMETCVSFTEFCKWYMMLRHGSGTREGETELPPPPKGTFSSRSSTLATLEKYETQTMAQIRELLKTLKYVATLETASLADLATRMDYNQYYSRQPVFSSAAGLSSSAFLRAEVQRAGGGSSSRQGFKRQRSGLELGQARSAGRRNPQANTGEDLMDLE
ncbi:Spc98 family-domain-containing protein [Polychytrium aggregatum]|uniref:Spc98 family-domain-containing protein n=1 Tax=Polychytrium aggregatum TaxID=110093 RepID=UPI0022FEFF84|nr:Spc98 family-domain-containing protein [Polychytrium aggregatum]KAI9204561.1 Spc98 family-domain-containing protein [Polychytrium aggregatum]